VRLGPVPTEAASIWLEGATRTLAALRRAPVVDVPPDVMETFTELVDLWTESLAETGDFVWDGEFDRQRILRVAAHWAAVASAPPAEARPFFDALLDCVATVLADVDVDSGASETLLAVVPDFDDRLPPTTPVPVRRRVLIVDDTEDIRFLVRLGLDHHPELEVCGEAVDGLHAIEQAAALRPDAVLLDLAMPRMTGLDALPRLRELVPAARIVIFSADLQAERAVLDAGADAFVAKGSDPELVARTLLGGA
jgi:two-component system, chemotaxis family, chemotaxis protein CheY